jgi:hypothetical protein
MSWSTETLTIEQRIETFLQSVSLQLGSLLQIAVQWAINKEVLGITKAGLREPYMQAYDEQSKLILEGLKQPGLTREQIEAGYKRLQSIGKMVPDYLLDPTEVQRTNWGNPWTDFPKTEMVKLTPSTPMDVAENKYRTEAERYMSNAPSTIGTVYNTKGDVKGGAVNVEVNVNNTFHDALISPAMIEEIAEKTKQEILEQGNRLLLNSTIPRFGSAY